ncbi:MAG: TetR/AcrR family transcriptional regulator [Bryobacterales bacterium]|nr:TetR/AcrR family transcriptional regulator [Bryobacterales bacterium]
MSNAERRARDREAARSRILDAASELFVSEGFSNVSLRKIAEKIDYAPATIYLYFRDKDHLLSCLCHEVFSQLCEAMEEIERTSVTPLEFLERVLRFYIDFGIRHPHHYRLALSLRAAVARQGADKHPDSQEANRTGLEAFDYLRRSLRLSADAGLVVVNDVEATAQTLWTFIHGTTSLLISVPARPHFPWVAQQDIIDTGIHIILRGLRPAAGSREQPAAAEPVTGTGVSRN